MPPPTAVDSWYAGRHFGIVIDAGSSGSRLQIYSWRDPVTVMLDKGDAVANTLPKVEKGTKIGEDWASKVEPGISSFADDPEGVAGYLRPLLNHAREHIPPSLHANTPLFLLATAGMRLLPPEKQARILKETCQFFVHHSHFKIDAPSETGPCGSSVMIITGEEEGLFGWIAVNYLMDGFLGTSDTRTTYGFLDMGGASTQIAFEPKQADEGDTKSLIDVRLRLLGGEEIHHKVFVTTWLGYGTNQARERYVGMAINEYEETRSDDADVIPDPCLPKGLELIETPVHLGHVDEHAKKTHHLRGTGSFEQCMQKTSMLLNKNAPCPDVPCLMNGVHVPAIDFSVSHFIGVSEYWFSSEHVFGLGGAYNFVQYERAASSFCAQDWQAIVHDHEESVKQHRLSGDGEVEGKNGEIVEVGKWGPQVEIPRLQMQCFKAAWIANVLHEGLEMPRIVDPGGNVTEGNKVEEKAASKGLGRPTFQSMDTVGDIAISWTLGKMVLEASKEVPPLKSSEPLVDPTIPDDFPVKPIRPFLDDLENRISPHLPSSLTRTSLGFSPVLLLFYTMLFFILVLVTYPLRRSIRSVFLRAIRSAAKRDSEAFSMEEGKFLSGTGYGSRPPSPTRSKKWLHPLRRVFSSNPHQLTRNTRPPALAISSLHSNFTNITIQNSEATPTRISPVRSYSLPAGMMSAGAGSRSPSPLASPNGFGFLDETNGGSSAFSRSRNASQINLSASIAPRPMSRVASLHSLGDGMYHDHDE